MKFSVDWCELYKMLRTTIDPAAAKAARAELSERQQRQIKTYNEALIIIPGSAVLVLLLPYALGLAAAAAILLLWFLRITRRNAQPMVDEHAPPGTDRP